MPAARSAAWRLMKALGMADARGWTRFASLRAYYTIAIRNLDREITPLLENEKVGLLVRGPLASGPPSGKYGRDGKGPESSRRSRTIPRPWA